MKIIFFGSDDFAASHLEALLNSKHEVVACVTQPDRPKGRGLKVSVSAVGELAQARGFTVLKLANLKDRSTIETLKKFDSDLFIVIAYGQILPADVLNIPKIFSVNVHGSLLPRYRGAAPINWAIINGDKETGLTIIKMNPEMDAGDVIAQKKITITPEDTSISLRTKMIEMGREFLLQTIGRIEKNDFQVTPQDPRAVTLAPKLTKELGHIDWNKSALEIHNLVRSLLPWPAAYTNFQDKILKILSSEVDRTVTTSGESLPGHILAVDKKGLVVKTGNGALLIKEVNLESGKRMDAYSFAIGHRVDRGTLLN